MDNSATHHTTPQHVGLLLPPLLLLLTSEISRPADDVLIMLLLRRRSRRSSERINIVTEHSGGRSEKYIDEANKRHSTSRKITRRRRTIVSPMSFFLALSSAASILIIHHSLSLTVLALVAPRSSSTRRPGPVLSTLRYHDGSYSSISISEGSRKRTTRGIGGKVPCYFNDGGMAVNMRNNSNEKKKKSIIFRLFSKLEDEEAMIENHDTNTDDNTSGMSSIGEGDYGPDPAKDANLTMINNDYHSELSMTSTSVVDANSTTTLTTATIINPIGGNPTTGPEGTSDATTVNNVPDATLDERKGVTDTTARITQKESYHWTSQHFELAVPALIGMLADPLLSLMDTAYVGRVGPTELAALGACTSIFHLAFNAFRATTTASK